MEAQLDAVMLPSMEAMAVKPQFYKLWSPLNLIKKGKNTKFGVVPDGSVLSYQLRETVNITGDVIVFSNVTKPPIAFPVLEQSVNTVLSYSVQRKWEAIELSFDECL